LKYSRISRQISLAIRDLYAQEPDLTGGAFNRRNANIEGDSIVLDIGNHTIVTPAIAQQYYSDMTFASTCDFSTLTTPTDYQFVDLLACYQVATFSTVLPVIKVDIDGNALPGNLGWEAISYGLEQNTCVDRYLGGC